MVLQLFQYGSRSSARLARQVLVALSFAMTLGVTTYSQERSIRDPLEWVDRSGDYRVEARFVKLDGNAVVMKTVDGLDLRIPFDQLSKESVDQAKAIAAAKNSGKSMFTPKESSGDSTPSDSSDSSPSSISLENLDAKSFVAKVVRELEKRNITVLWDAMPASKQKDIEKIIAAFATRLDPKSFDMLRKTRNTALDIARKQQKFVIGSSVFQIPSDVKESLNGAYPYMVDFVDALITKELFDPKRLQAGNMRSFIDDWKKGLNSSIEKLATTLPEGDPGRAALLESKIDYTLESNSSDTATMKLQSPAGPMGPGQEVSLELIRAEGRWIPKQMVDGWESGVGQTLAAVNTINGEQVHQQLQGFLFLLNAPLQTLKNAKSQEEFDKTLMDIAQAFQGMAGNVPGAAPGR
ncbi:MAG: hypothetical protein KGQ51_11135 [Planctomycetes bacterium]|nr:hypothetical protein [Planctomycetota bacterium]